jgi:hypothetical protein
MQLYEELVLTYLAELTAQKTNQISNSEVLAHLSSRINLDQQTV